MRGWLGMVLAGAVACGGTVVEEPGQGSGGGADGDDPSGELPKSPLPPCELGDLPEPLKECPWIANGLCYDEKVAACACECRRTDGTLCMSGFPGTYVEVSCP